MYHIYVHFYEGCDDMKYSLLRYVLLQIVIHYIYEEKYIFVSRILILFLLINIINL